MGSGSDEARESIGKKGRATRDQEGNVQHESGQSGYRVGKLPSERLVGWIDSTGLTLLVIDWRHPKERILKTGFTSCSSTCCPLVTEWAARRNWTF
jgi:hypothetical protein